MSIDNYNLFVKYKQTKDNELRNEIVEKYLYIAEIIAKKFSGRGVDFDDLYQVASFALLKGIERFDVTMNLQFATFITPTIAGEIKNYFRDKSRLIKLPRRMYMFSTELKKYSEKLLKETGKNVTAKELAVQFNVTEEEILNALELGSSTISLDSSVDGVDSNLYDIIPDEKNYFEKFENSEELNAIMTKLNENERELIKLRFKEGLSQSDISKKWNVSQMFISRMERKTINKMQAYMFND
jgi:RNA polymerase sigma-B factor